MGDLQCIIRMNRYLNSTIKDIQIVKYKNGDFKVEW
jgi:hypothetical protein